MPGISFLFKKGFHPQTMENQKKLFIAEQTQMEHKRLEDERALEVIKEKETHAFMASETKHVDPRQSALKFMYAQPLSKSNHDKKKAEFDKLGKHFEPKVGDDGDDEMVRAFRQRLARAEGQSSEVSSSKDVSMNVMPMADVEMERERNKKIKLNPNFGASAHQSTLEAQAGKRRNLGLTQEEQAERFSFLKNAPVEGAFAMNIHVRHKPFNEVVRNVQCIRCGEWGHQSGDRECALRDYNPHDFARQKREDPLTYMQSEEFLLEKQKMIIRHAHAFGHQSSSLSGGPSDGRIADTSNKGSSSSNTSVVDGRSLHRGYASNIGSAGASETLDDGESDPEAEFIASLTAREKKLLLRKLQKLESNDSSSLSDQIAPDAYESGSSSSSSDESSADEREKRHKGSSKHKSKKKSKKDKA